MPLFQQQLYKTLHVLCNLKKLVFCRGGGVWTPLTPMVQQNTILGTSQKKPSSFIMEGRCV